MLFLQAEVVTLFDEVCDMEGLDTIDSNPENAKSLLQNFFVFLLANIGDGTVNGGILVFRLLKEMLQRGTFSGASGPSGSSQGHPPSPQIASGNSAITPSHSASSTSSVQIASEEVKIKSILHKPHNSNLFLLLD
jgi:hypothetical protein